MICSECNGKAFSDTILSNGTIYHESCNHCFGSGCEPEELNLPEGYNIDDEGNLLDNEVIVACRDDSGNAYISKAEEEPYSLEQQKALYIWLKREIDD